MYDGAPQDQGRQFGVAWGIRSRHALQLWWSEFHLIRSFNSWNKVACSSFSSSIKFQLEASSTWLQIPVESAPKHTLCITILLPLCLSFVFCQFESAFADFSCIWYSHMVPPFPGFRAFSCTVCVPVWSVALSIIFHLTSCYVPVSTSKSILSGFILPVIL